MLTTDSEYVKMVLALPEGFFEEWEWKEGDGYIRRPPGETDFVDIQYIGHRTYWDYKKTIYCINEVGDAVDGEIRPIPSQKQIQQILMKKFNWSPKALLQMFLFWAEINMKRDVFWPFESFECGWLSYCMYISYEKIWNGEAWV